MLSANGVSVQHHYLHSLSFIPGINLNLIQGLTDSLVATLHPYCTASVLNEKKLFKI